VSPYPAVSAAGLLIKKNIFMSIDQRLIDRLKSIGDLNTSTSVVTKSRLDTKVKTVVVLAVAVAVLGGITAAVIFFGLK
jgi:hypothetical protein